MAISTGAELLDAIATWMNRTDLPGENIVVLSESRIARDVRVRNQVTSANLSTVAGTQTVALPTDLLEMDNIGISSSSPPRMLHYLTPEAMDEKFPNAYWTGTPATYTIIGNNLLLGPTPDAVYTVQVDYFARFPTLSGGGSTTNWLLTYHPDVYLFAALAEASNYMMDEQRTAMWESRYMRAVEALNTADDTSGRSGSSLSVRAL